MKKVGLERYWHKMEGFELGQLWVIILALVFGNYVILLS